MGEFYADVLAQPAAPATPRGPIVQISAKRKYAPAPKPCLPQLGKRKRNWKSELREEAGPNDHRADNQDKPAKAIGRWGGSQRRPSCTEAQKWGRNGNQRVNRRGMESENRKPVASPRLVPLSMESVPTGPQASTEAGPTLIPLNVGTFRENYGAGGSQCASGGGAIPTKGTSKGLPQAATTG